MFFLQTTSLPPVRELRPKLFSDVRGLFVKTFVRTEFARLGLRTDFAESYYSLSHERVVRGMHFQTPPHDHAKLVYCLTGRVLDVVVDLRRREATYGHVSTTEISSDIGNLLYIPPGFAHGFLVLEAPAIMLYHVTSEYAPAADAGFRWDSIGFNWPEPCPVVSARDAGFQSFADFISPF